MASDGWANSYGFGHGPAAPIGTRTGFENFPARGFGHGPFGHGPVPAFPLDEPGLPHVVETEGAVRGIVFADGSDQRFLVARDAAQTVRAVFPAPSSADVLAVRSHYELAAGRRFTVVDPVANVGLWVRHVGPLTVTRRGNLREPLVLTGRVSRPDGFGRAFAAMAPTLWYRMTEATGAGSAYNNAWPVLGGGHATMTVPPSCGVVGPIEALLPSAIVVSARVDLTDSVIPGATDSTDAVAFAARFQRIYPPVLNSWQTIHRTMQSVFSVLGEGLGLAISSLGGVVLYSGMTALAQSPPGAVNDAEAHFAYAEWTGSGAIVWLDGTVVGTGSTPFVSGTAVVSFSLFGDTASGPRHLYAAVNDLGFWKDSFTLPSSAQLRAAYAAWRPW